MSAIAADLFSHDLFSHALGAGRGPTDKSYIARLDAQDAAADAARRRSDAARAFRLGRDYREDGSEFTVQTVEVPRFIGGLKARFTFLTDSTGQLRAVGQNTIPPYLPFRMKGLSAPMARALRLPRRYMTLADLASCPEARSALMAVGMYERDELLRIAADRMDRWAHAALAALDDTPKTSAELTAGIEDSMNAIAVLDRACNLRYIGLAHGTPAVGDTIRIAADGVRMRELLAAA